MAMTRGARDDPCLVVTLSECFGMSSYVVSFLIRSSSLSLPSGIGDHGEPAGFSEGIKGRNDCTTIFAPLISKRMLPRSAV